MPTNNTNNNDGNDGTSSTSSAMVHLSKWTRRQKIMWNLMTKMGNGSGGGGNANSNVAAIADGAKHNLTLDRISKLYSVGFGKSSASSTMATATAAATMATHLAAVKTLARDNTTNPNNDTATTTTATMDFKLENQGQNNGDSQQLQLQHVVQMLPDDNDIDAKKHEKWNAMLMSLKDYQDRHGE